jgi:phosphoadenosine phosphosulfate reductase
MPFEAPARSAAETAAADINHRFAPKDACGVIAHALTQHGRIALVSSFGAESVVLLHMAASVDRAVPVLFINTGMLMPETPAYQALVAERLGLSNVQVVKPDPVALLTRDTDALLHLADTEGCCALRKTEPLARALAPFDGWISGRKRIHGGQRVALDLAETDGARLKLNPLAHWSGREIAAYMEAHDLPRHPLAARGFSSIGCAPCTSPSLPGESPRAGRWRGADKTECGIHFIDGKAVRT